MRVGLLALLTFCPFVLIAASAQAATLKTGSACYRSGDNVNAQGSGFLPGVTYNVLLDNEAFGSSMVEADGSIVGRFEAPKIKSGTGEQSFALSVSDGVNTAATDFRVTEFSADFNPARGNVRKVKVRFSGYGFGASKTVYLHYLRPNGKEHKTVKLGGTTGPCGKFRSTLRKLFPFDPKAGKWTLRFDTSKPISSKVSSVRVSVTVRDATASSAAAATVQADKPCYLTSEDPKITGSGFTPSADVQVTVNGTQSNLTRTKSDGTLSGTLSSLPSLNADQFETDNTVDFDGVSTTFKRVQRSVTPSSSKGKATRKIKVKVYGFGTDGTKKTLYAHYVRGIKSYKTVNLGTTTGDCGDLVASLKLGPKKSAAKGRWSVQIDANPSYSLSETDDVTLFTELR